MIALPAKAHYPYVILCAGAIILLVVVFSRSGDSYVLPPTCTPPPTHIAHTKQITDSEALASLQRMGGLLINSTHGRGHCTIKQYGTGWGAHDLCQMPASALCRFISFGISNDYSFDTDLANNNCKGLALDPTVTHPAKIHNNVWFMAIGATSLASPPASWIVTSVPSLLKWVQWDKIDVLKMDCEGCEYAIARDLLLEDPDMFRRVKQFAVEVHVSRTWVSTTEAVINMGKLFYLLEEAGHKLISATFLSCSPVDEAPGCHTMLEDLGYPCQSGKMCHNYLFARVP